MVLKVRIKVGQIEIEYEGPEAYLDKHMPTLIKQLSEIAKSTPNIVATDAPGDASYSSDPGPLVSFLKEKKATSAQVRKFLATAQWLHLKGKDRLITKDITQAISDSKQTHLGNASDILNKNIGKGFCEKDGAEFYVTPEGKADLG